MIYDLSCLYLKLIESFHSIFSARSPEKPKRKRNVSGESRVRRNSQNKGSPVKNTTACKSVLKGSPVKCSPTETPLRLSFDDPAVPLDGPEPSEIIQVSICLVYDLFHSAMK